MIPHLSSSVPVGIGKPPRNQASASDITCETASGGVFVWGKTHAASKIATQLDLHLAFRACTRELIRLDVRSGHATAGYGPQQLELSPGNTACRPEGFLPLHTAPDLFD